MDGYSHTQKAPLYAFIYATAIALGIGAWVSRDESPLVIVLGGSAGVIFLIASAFHHLTVKDQGHRLLICFGPLPLFRKTVEYADIATIEIGRTLILEGWGIHYSMTRGGWVWNLWGRDCVVLHLRNGEILRIGTDDASNLARFLHDKISAGVPSP